MNITNENIPTSIHTKNTFTKISKNSDANPKINRPIFVFFFTEINSKIAIIKIKTPPNNNEKLFHVPSRFPFIIPLNIPGAILSNQKNNWVN